MRALHLVPLLVLAGCGAAEPAGEGLKRIDCAIGANAPFAPDCTLEPSRAGTRRLIVVHHKDGGFRRFEQVDDGRGLVVADGVEEAHVAWTGDGRLEVSVGDDRYRFPARVKPDDAATP